MLELKNIFKIQTTSNSTRNVLDGISIRFRKKEFVTILGPSGSGKSSLLNVISGLDSYSKGDIFINDQSTKNFSETDWDNFRNHSVGLIFRQHGLISHLNIINNIQLMMAFLNICGKEKRKRAKELLKSVGLSDCIYKKPHQLTSEQIHRATIARALANDPDIILVDEPTANLDSYASKQILDLLKSLTKDKLVIVITDDINIAKKYANRVIELRDGEVIEDSDPFNENDKSNYKLIETKMKLATILKLASSFLMSTKLKTCLTVIANSIGVIGIGLVLSLTAGLSKYHVILGQDIVNSLNFNLFIFAMFSVFTLYIITYIITNLTILTRIKELAILRTLGAHKRDIAKLFHIQALIIGILSGIIGVISVYLINVPVNQILYNFTGLKDVLQFNLNQILVLIIASILLTFMGNVIPTKRVTKITNLQI